jgi:hypothetical protein
VDWYLCGEAAFAKARAEDRPILLSVGYATCHWGHAMGRESVRRRLLGEGRTNKSPCERVALGLADGPEAYTVLSFTTRQAIDPHLCSYRAASAFNAAGE